MALVVFWSIMKPTDGTITKQDVLTVIKLLDQRGLIEELIELYGREPRLLDALSDSWGLIKEVMDQIGLSEPQQRALMQRIHTHTARGLLLLDRGHRALWADLLPGDSTEGERHE